MENLISIVFILTFVVACVIVILVIKKRFVNQSYPSHTSAMLEDINNLQNLGFDKKEDRYTGTYRKFHVTIFATTTIRNNDRFQVLVATSPQPGQLKNIGGPASLYFVTGETKEFAYTGFILNPKLYNEPGNSIKGRLDKLIDILEQNNVIPYQV